MKIEHVALYTRDLEGMKIFYCRYFGAVSNDGYYNPKTTFRSYFLTFTDGARLELMQKQGVCDGDQRPERLGFIHLAFSVGSKERVDTLTAQLKADGYPVLSGPRTTGDGYYESCVTDPEGNLVEITV